MKAYPTELELGQIARIGSTVPSLFDININSSVAPSSTGRKPTVTQVKRENSEESFYSSIRTIYSAGEISFASSAENLVESSIGLMALDGDEGEEGGRVFLPYWKDPPSPLPMESASAMSLVTPTSSTERQGSANDEEAK